MYDSPCPVSVPRLACHRHVLYLLHTYTQPRGTDKQNQQRSKLADMCPINCSSAVSFQGIVTIQTPLFRGESQLSANIFAFLIGSDTLEILIFTNLKKKIGF